MLRCTIYFLFLTFLSQAFGQNFYFGQDLSYANEMEDCGAAFKEGNVAKDVYQIFANHGTNLVRIRLWHTPSWQNTLKQPIGVKSQYSDFTDVKEAISRIKAAGMQVMLDLPLSDFWADPSAQLIPAAWVPVASSYTTLGDSVYNYVTKVLTNLNAAELMPDIVKIGNETNSGILQHTTLNANYTVSGSISSDWSRHAYLFNKAIAAVRAVSATSTTKPKIALHCAGISTVKWWYQNIIKYGVTDFDIIGFSYYYAWHGGSIATLKNTVSTLRQAFSNYKVMIIETGYLWTTQNYDALQNIINTPDSMYLPVSPEKQKEYMVDMTREVKKAGGIGIIFWEPDWVTTQCKTPWGTGSSQDHVAFFDPVNHNFMANGAGTWPEAPFYDNLSSHKATFKVNMSGHNVSKGVWIASIVQGGNMEIQKMASEGNNVYAWYTFLPAGNSIAYYFLNDSNLNSREPFSLGCFISGDTLHRFTGGSSDSTLIFNWNSCLSDSVADDEPVTIKNANILDIKLYPNPCKDRFQLAIVSSVGNVVVQILDSSGIILKQIVSEPDNKEITINASLTSTNLCLVKAIDGLGNLFVGKMVIDQ